MLSIQRIIIFALSSSSFIYGCNFPVNKSFLQQIIKRQTKKTTDNTFFLSKHYTTRSKNKQAPSTCPKGCTTVNCLLGAVKPSWQLMWESLPTNKKKEINATSNAHALLTFICGFIAPTNPSFASLIGLPAMAAASVHLFTLNKETKKVFKQTRVTAAQQNEKTKAPKNNTSAIKIYKEMPFYMLWREQLQKPETQQIRTDIRNWHKEQSNLQSNYPNNTYTEHMPTGHKAIWSAHNFIKKRKKELFTEAKNGTTHTKITHIQEVGATNDAIDLIQALPEWHKLVQIKAALDAAQAAQNAQEAANQTRKLVRRLAYFMGLGFGFVLFTGHW